MIGRSCKPREGFRRAVLIGRALHLIYQSTKLANRDVRPAWTPCNPEGAPAPSGPRRANALHGRNHGGEDHPIPFRTRKLSSPSPKVLRCSPWEDRTFCPCRALPCPGAFASPGDSPKLLRAPREGAFLVLGGVSYLPISLSSAPLIGALCRAHGRSFSDLLNWVLLFRPFARWRAIIDSPFERAGI